MSEKKQAEIPKCEILGVKIAAVDMPFTLSYLTEHIRELSGKYICVSNVHTTVMSMENPAYRKVQNHAFMALPDGKPLSVECHRRGWKEAKRVTGPDLMGEIFSISAQHGYRHYFYGSTQETLDLLKEKLKERYPGITIAGMYSPPFRKLNEEEDAKIVEMINETEPDFVWVGLGAPKQENWMAAHKGKVKGLMIGVGAGFDYHADNIKRAPMWMQKASLEWLYRLMQDPKRLFKRYMSTNFKFILHAVLLRK